MVVFTAEGAAAWGMLFLFFFVFVNAGNPGAPLAGLLAVFMITSVMVACLAVLYVVPRWIGERFRVSSVPIVVTAAILSGVSGYWLLALMTAVNDCTLGVAMPLLTMDPCNH
ncbi:MAG: hypothetical protein WEC75_06620 [Dehalococcoidia bacterium]